MVAQCDSRLLHERVAPPWSPDPAHRPIGNPIGGHFFVRRLLLVSPRVLLGNLKSSLSESAAFLPNMEPILFGHLAGGQILRRKNQLPLRLWQDQTVYTIRVPSVPMPHQDI